MHVSHQNGFHASIRSTCSRLIHDKGRRKTFALRFPNGPLFLWAIFVVKINKTRRSSPSNVNRSPRKPIKVASDAEETEKSRLGSLECGHAHRFRTLCTDRAGAVRCWCRKKAGQGGAMRPQQAGAHRCVDNLKCVTEQKTFSANYIVNFKSF